jgi:hypothetical protein
MICLLELEYEFLLASSYLKDAFRTRSVAAFPLPAGVGSRLPPSFGPEPAIVVL